MEQHLIDTNVVSDYLSASFPDAGMVLMDKAIDAIPNISIITQIELLCWKADDITAQNVNDFIVDCVVLNITPYVIAHCVNLRKSKKIKTPDAIIAATALAHNFTIISRNTSDFKHIQGLKVIDPYKL